jgi:uncharacterized repeat protein (TIGR03943 family)
MIVKLQRIVHPLIALSWSGAMLYFYGSGRIVKYLAPSFRPLCLYGALGLAVIGLFVLLTSREKSACGHDHSCDEAHDHESGDMHPLMSMLLMLAPLVFAVFNTTDGYSIDVLSRKSLYNAPLSKDLFFAKKLSPLTLADIEKSHTKNGEGNYQFNLMELYFAVGDPELKKLLDGMKIETEGRLVAEKENNARGTRRRLYRLFITCCAADARAIPIIIEFGEGALPGMEENTWVKISGKINFPVENGSAQALLLAETCKKSNPPYEESFMRNY